MTTKLKPHPLAHIIHAWADGRTIQFHIFSTGEWIDYTSKSASEPQFVHPSRDWRIKPETVRYRLYLRLTESGAKMSCTTDEKYNVQDLVNFIEWRGDWKEEEI